MTPIAEIAGLKIGSRPASRTKSDRIEDLRAIPWVFSWAQARVMLPGWYGVGAGARRRSRTRRCSREMARAGRSSPRRSPIWRWCWPSPTWAIAARYAALVEDEALRDAIFGAHPRRLAARPMTGCSTITGQTRLLGEAPGARRLDPAAPALYRAAQPAPDRTDEAPPRRRGRPADRRGHPAVDQRDRDGAEEQRLRPREIAELFSANSRSPGPARASATDDAGFRPAASPFSMRIPTNAAASSFGTRSSRPRRAVEQRPGRHRLHLDPPVGADEPHMPVEPRTLGRIGHPGLAVTVSPAATLPR